MTAIPTRPLIRWHGSKFRLAPWIIANLPSHQEYLEPFGGSLAILLLKGRCKAETVNDLDSEVVTLYRVLRDPEQSEQLIRACALTPFSREEFNIAYHPITDPVEASRRLIFRSFAGVGSTGATRRNSTGFRWGVHNKEGVHCARSWDNYPEALRVIVERLRGVVVEHQPAEQLIARYTNPNCLIYCDPPYVFETRSVRYGGHAYRHEMTDDQHEVLAGLLCKSPCMVAISGYPSDIYERLYKGWERRDGKAHAFGANQGQRSKRVECLWLNPAAIAGLDQRLNFEVAL